MAAVETSFLLSNDDSSIGANNLDLSEQEVVDCSSDNICTDGAWPKDVLNMVACRGSLYEYEAPYRGYDDNNRCPDATAARHDTGVVGYSWIKKTNLDIRRALYHAPLVTLVKGGADDFYVRLLLLCGVVGGGSGVA